MMMIGSLLKLLSASPDRFYVAFIGQALVGTSTIFILGVPARLAAVWFPSRQVSTACSLGVFGNQLGVALGFLIPPIVVKNEEKLEDIGKQLMVLYYILGSVSTAAFLLVVFCKKEPPLPAEPGITSDNSSSQTYLETLKTLLTNKNFLLLLVSYGLNVGVYYVISTLLNQMLLHHFPDSEKDAGRIGLCMVLAGVVGSVIAGVILDKTHKFK
ncbi:Feline leukemia virus subgroup C receptor-related protein 2 [Blattella germanica]|nr:Feline leukemia virus subgroup C receptor-related protein 2 [Blattella germanica]